MSVRPTIYPITAIEPIRQSTGSRDSSLVDRIRDAYIHLEEERYKEDEVEAAALAEDEYAGEQGPWEIDEEELRYLTKLAKAFVNGRFRRNQEPGEWRRVIVYLAHALGLTATKHPYFGDWTTDAWRQYLVRVSEWLPEGPFASLKHLVEGRSLTGREIEQDGCSYAWLTSSEVSELLAAIRELPQRLLDEPAPPPALAADLLAALGERSESDPGIRGGEWLPGFHRELIECLSACEGKCLFLAG